jgi:hypothetical protein
MGEGSVKFSLLGVSKGGWGAYGAAVGFFSYLTFLVLMTVGSSLISYLISTGVAGNADFESV